MTTNKPHGGELKTLHVTTPKKRKELLIESHQLPKILLNPRQLCDLELLMNGGFSPLTGFMTEEEYTSVVDSMHLPNGLLWPMPIVLDVEDASLYKIGQKVTLADEYGKPVAILTIQSIFAPDRLKEAQSIYKTTSIDHFGVRYLLKKTNPYYLGGDVVGIDTVDRFDFLEYRATPEEMREYFKKNKWDKVIGFQTRNPIHRVHFELIKRAALQNKAHVMIHPSVGLTKDGDIDYITRVRVYLKLQQKYMESFAIVRLLPLAMRMAGPKEALWHALIRKNYGVTHFVVGRDHAGPGDIDGKQLYRPYEAQELALQYEKELGVTIIPFQEMVYVEEKKKYIPTHLVQKEHTVRSISGTKLLAMIRNGEKVPAWISFKETVEELRKGVEKEKKDGLTIFFTGLPSAGKSTLARILYFRLLELQNKKITLLDGDVIRQHLSKGLGFDKKDRDTNIRRIGFVANEITKHGGIAICAAVSPYKEARDANRYLISGNGTYVEVYVSTPIKECQKRDVKGLYWKSKKGSQKGVTGVDDPYEKPENAEIVLPTIGKTPLQCVSEIIEYLTKNGLIQIEK